MSLDKLAFARCKEHREVIIIIKSFAFEFESQEISEFNSIPVVYFTRQAREEYLRVNESLFSLIKYNYKI